MGEAGYISSDDTMWWVDPGQQQSTHQPLSCILSQQGRQRELEGQKQEKLVAQEKNSLVNEEKNEEGNHHCSPTGSCPGSVWAMSASERSRPPVLLLSKAYGME